MLPMVTGSRLARKKLPQVKLAILGAFQISAAPHLDLLIQIYLLRNHSAFDDL
jgi:hypothetical protein